MREIEKNAPYKTEISQYNQFPYCLSFYIVHFKPGKNYETDGTTSYTKIISEQYDHLLTFLVNIYMKYYIKYGRYCPE